MALADIFYPGNPQRREDLLRTHQQIVCCLEDNVVSANELAVTLNTYCGSNLPPIEYNSKGTIKEACDTFVARIQEIKLVVAKFHEQLKDQLGTEAFQKLSGMMEYSNNSFEIARKVISVTEGVVGAVGAIAVIAIKALTSSENVTMLCRCVSVIGASVFGSLLLGVGLLVVDAILSAILGAIERSNLENALTEYRKHLDDIKPPSKAFQRSVVEIQVLIKNHLK